MIGWNEWMQIYGKILFLYLEPRQKWVPEGRDLRPIPAFVLHTIHWKHLHIAMGEVLEISVLFCIKLLYNLLSLFVVHSGGVVVVVEVNQEEVDRGSASCLTFTLRSELLEALGYDDDDDSRF